MNESAAIFYLQYPHLAHFHQAAYSSHQQQNDVGNQSAVDFHQQRALSLPSIASFLAAPNLSVADVDEPEPAQAKTSNDNAETEKAATSTSTTVVKKEDRVAKGKRYRRAVFTEEQRYLLEQEFASTMYITSNRKVELSHRLGLTERQVKVWFQNRRSLEGRLKRNREKIATAASAPPSHAPPLSQSDAAAAAAKQQQIEHDAVLAMAMLPTTVQQPQHWQHLQSFVEAFPQPTAFSGLLAPFQLQPPVDCCQPRKIDDAVDRATTKDD